jgi:DNA-binding NtrC family response regulator
MAPDQQRREGDRRAQPRGGRRSTDAPGFAPMVMVIDQDPRRRDVSETILAKLRFAVAPFDSIDKAIAVMQALRPDVIVLAERDANQLRDRLPPDRDGKTIPIVTLNDELLTPDALVESIRQALRTT